MSRHRHYHVVMGLDLVKEYSDSGVWPLGISTVRLAPGDEIKALRKEVEKVFNENGVKNVDLRTGPLSIAKKEADEYTPRAGIVALWRAQDLEEESDSEERDLSQDEDGDESADEKYAAVGSKHKHVLYLLSREQIKGEPILWNAQMLAGSCGKTVAGLLLAYNSRKSSLFPELIRSPIRRTSLLKFISGLNGDSEIECVVCYATIDNTATAGLLGANKCVKCASVTCNECFLELVMDSQITSKKKFRRRVLRCPVCSWEQTVNIGESIESLKLRVVSEPMKVFVKFWNAMNLDDFQNAVLCDFSKMTAKMRATIREDIDQQFFDLILGRMKMRTKVGGFGKTKAEWRRELKRYRGLRTIWRPLLLKALDAADSGNDMKLVGLGRFDPKKKTIDIIEGDAYDPHKIHYLPVTAEMLPAVAKLPNAEFFPLERMDDRSVVKASSERVAVGSVERSDRCARCQKAFWDKKEQMRAPKCAKCKRTAYCSTQCRKKHRVVHSRVCKGKKKRKKKI